MQNSKQKATGKPVAFCFKQLLTIISYADSQWCNVNHDFLFVP